MVDDRNAPPARGEAKVGPCVRAGAVRRRARRQGPPQGPTEGPASSPRETHAGLTVSPHEVSLHEPMRDDVHAPKNFNPDDYQLLDVVDAEQRIYHVALRILPEGGWVKEVTDVKTPKGEALDLIHERGANVHPGLSRCDHCGAHIRYAALHEHGPSGEIVVSGTQCATERFGVSEMKYLRKRAEQEAKRRATLEDNVKQKSDFNAAHPGLMLAIRAELEREYNSFLDDMVSAYESYHGLTERQVEVTERILADRFDAYNAQFEERDEAGAAEPSEWIGSEGERLDLTVTVEKILAFENGYGGTYLHIMRDEEGNRLVWFASATSKSGNQMEEGETWAVRGTVKTHDRYQGERQTRLTRVSPGEMRSDEEPSEGSPDVAGGGAEEDPKGEPEVT